MHMVRKRLAIVALLLALPASAQITGIDLRKVNGQPISITNPVPINCIVGCGGAGGAGGSSALDSSVFVSGVTLFTLSGGVYNDALSAITTGNAATFRMTTNRGLHINLRNNSGTEIGTASNPIRTDPTGTTTQPVSAASLPLPTGAAQDSTLAETHAAAAATLPAKAQEVGGSDYGGTPAMRIVKVDSSGQLYIGGMPVTHVVVDAGGSVIGHVILDSGSTTAVTQATAANLNATVTQGPAGAAAWKVDGSAVTQPVSIATNTPDVTDRSARLLGHVTVDSAPTIAVTNAGLSNIPADPAREGGNLASVATNTAAAATSEAAINAKLPSLTNGAQPVVIVQNIVATPPILSAAQTANPLLYRAAMKQFCQTNLCPSLGK
jgi:hypothetical protein